MTDTLKLPVVFLSLKNVDGLTYEKAVYRLTVLVGMEAERFSFLQSSEKLAENEKERYRALTTLRDGKFAMNEDLLISSLQVLSQLLHRHYGKKVIILIDEYDVPLDKAFQHGYYRQMAALIRGLFGQALKTNDCLQFAVLTVRGMSSDTRTSSLKIRGPSRSRIGSIRAAMTW